MKDKSVTFAKLKERLIKEGYVNADSFMSIADIPKIKIFEMIERIQKAK